MTPWFCVAFQWLALFLFAGAYLVTPFCPVSDARNSARGWVDGTHDLIVRERRLISVDERVELAPGLAFAQEVPRPEVGDQRKFYATDFARGGIPYSATATCRAVGEFCYIFVEDEQWERGTVTHTGVIKLKRAFDESTPGDPARGIYELEAQELAPPPDKIDLDPKIYILILDIPDNFVGSGNFVAGYFEPVNQRRGIVRDPMTGLKFYSNQVEMVYLDADPLEIGTEQSKEILAHEFQHLIHWRHDPNEDTWVNEGCSDYAALFLCGYSRDFSWHVKAFEDEPQTSLVYWPYGAANSMANYGAVYLWMVYLSEHYGGVPTISALITQQANGLNGINATLSARGYSQNFEGVFSGWKIANFLDDGVFSSGEYGYSYLDLEIERGGGHSTFPVSDVSRYIKSWAADYIEFTGGERFSDLQIDFAASNPAHEFDVRVIEMKDGAPIAVESMQIEAGIGRISVPRFGHDVDMVVLVPSWQPKSSADFGGGVSYSYSARLGQEVSFEAVVLPNAVHERYVDIVVQLDGDTEAVVPRITISRLGKTLVDDQSMVSISLPEVDSGSKTAYVYQLYVPHDWELSEIRWDVYYLSRWVVGGDLGAM